MENSQFNIERATNGLVLALYVAAAIFLAVMLYHVLRDIDERRPTPADDAAVLKYERLQEGPVRGARPVCCHLPASA